LKRWISIMALVVISAGLSTPASAKGAQLGVQGGFGGDLDWYIGARAEFETARIFKNARMVADFDYFFPGGNFNYYEFDLNYLWPLTTFAENSDSNLYAGAGLNVGRGKPDGGDSNWQMGMNVLGGFSYDLSDRSAFVEGGYTFFSDYDQWHVGTGFLF